MMQACWAPGALLDAPEQTGHPWGQIPDWAKVDLSSSGSQPLSHLFLLQHSVSASRPANGSADQGVLWESAGTDPPLESEVISLLRHPASSDVANERP